MGKTRLLAELSSYIDDQNKLVYWRLGRSLPYGEGITFWALGEIVKAQADILKSDSPQIASDKLRTAVDAVVEDTDERTWVTARLSPLVGTQTAGTGGGAEKEESFTAWRRFLEAIAARSPLVLVFEDLHWADAAMLEFIDHLVEWSTDVPLLIVCTTRPELYESHGGWGGGKRNSNTISLSSLSDSETSQLISALLSQAVLPAEVHAALLERAGGNPLYAEEFIRMLSDRGILQRKGRVQAIDPDADIAIPDNVQALIAARLDSLSPERKALLHDASVAGKVFWSGAVASLSGRDGREVREGLHELVRKELVRPARNSSVEGQQEYSFWHALVRDVAYGQIPRAARGRRHRAMAEWIEATAGDRVGDQAEVLVHHYTQALDLAKASGDDGEAENLSEPTLRFLILAGDRAIDLDVAKARDYFRRALDLLPSGHPLRAPTLVKAGLSFFHEGSLDEGQVLFEEAIILAEQGGDPGTQGVAMLGLARLCWWKGDAARDEFLTAQAVQVLERHPPGWELVRVYVNAAQIASFTGQLQAGLELSEKALGLAQRLDDAKGMVDAGAAHGFARCDVGDFGGLIELQGALDDGLRLGLGHDTSSAYSALAEWTWLIGALPASQVYEDYIGFAERRGLTAAMRHAQAESLRVRFDLGQWDELIHSARDLLSWSEDHGNLQTEAIVLSNTALVLLFRGRTDDAAAIQGRLIRLAQDIGDLQVVVPALAVAALAEQTHGHNDQAVDLIAELDHVTEKHHGYRARYLPTAIRVLISAGKLDEAEKFMAGMEVSAARDQNSLLTGQALVAESAGRLEEACDLYREVASKWAGHGFALEGGQANFGLGRCLIALGDCASATEQLQKARAIFTRLQARPLIDEVDRHLKQQDNTTVRISHARSRGV